ncbi:tetraacyldisaccharide 4'-kinase [Escherichia coli]|uniref:tetraacyldisaccharide 4'-kinase n=1 Tax=Escherichia coli TaxID=562 RepID=UPI00331590AE
MIDGTRGIGNGRVIPAGPLRAPLSPQLERTDALIVVGGGDAARTIAADLASRGKPVLSAHLKPDQASLAALSGMVTAMGAGAGGAVIGSGALNRSSSCSIWRSTCGLGAGTGAGSGTNCWAWAWCAWACSSPMSFQPRSSWAVAGLRPTKPCGRIAGRAWPLRASRLEESEAVGLGVPNISSPQIAKCRCNYS